jgi:Glycosyl hydrolase family 9
MQLSLSHLGYQPNSPKTLTLLAEGAEDLSDAVPFFLRQNCLRLPRQASHLAGFSERFPAPYNLIKGRLEPVPSSAVFYRGELRRTDTRWGRLWQADFSAFTTPGSYQIETDRQISPPFAIRELLYDRIILGYLTFLKSQRCGCAIFGVHVACHLDDGILDIDGSPHDATGGWHDAGDFRKWLAFTLPHIEALLSIHEHCEDLRRGGDASDALLEELRWGNRFFHRMIAASGKVYEDVAGGRAPAGRRLSYENDWWFENHPGCFGDASDNRWTDNIAGSGDERTVRTTYNPLVQWSFVQMQARAALHLPANEARECAAMAKRAADYGTRRGHDGRTLFLAAELRARLEMRILPEAADDAGPLLSVAQRLLDRHVLHRDGLAGFFLEEETAKDAFRSIAFAAEPVFALLRLWELRSTFDSDAFAEQARTAVIAYVERYLLADSSSNPFSLTPYGVYPNPPHPERQLFRNAGAGYGVRTFMHPFNAQGIVHGTSSVLMTHAHLLARGAALLDRPDWRLAAERLLHWCLGHNTCNRSLLTGIGYRQPVGYSFRIPQLPEAMFVGFIGRPDDTPYLEESTAIEWNTLEYWSVPYQQAAQAAVWLRH